MNITFEELRRIKHSLPSGSVSKIAEELKMDEQSVRNFFGAKPDLQEHGQDFHFEAGPSGGLMRIKDTSVFDAAMRILYSNGKVVISS